jgi:hypothetical protein
MQVFLTKGMARFARREQIGPVSLREAIARAESGLIDADLGGCLIKQGVARAGKGRSGGYRTIIAFRRGGRAVFLYGFAKNERENVGLEELTELRKVGQNWLSASPQKIAEALEEQLLQEVLYGNEKEIKPT